MSASKEKKKKETGAESAEIVCLVDTVDQFTVAAAVSRYKV